VRAASKLTSVGESTSTIDFYMIAYVLRQ